MDKNRPKIFFRIKNFKSLENVELQISPLTFLFGPNGSGKSSIFKALRFLRANLFPLSPNKLNFKVDKTIDLNSFEDVVLNGNKSKRIIMEIEVESGLWYKMVSEHRWLYEDKMETSIDSFNHDLVKSNLVPSQSHYSEDDISLYELKDQKPVFEFGSIFDGQLDDPDLDDEYFNLGAMKASSGNLWMPEEIEIKNFYSQYNLIFPIKFRIEFSMQDKNSVIELIRIESPLEKFFIEFYPSLASECNTKCTISVFNNARLDKIFQYFYDNFWGVPFYYDNYYEFLGALHKFFYYKVQKTDLWRESSYEQKRDIYYKIKYWYHLTYQYVPEFLQNLLDLDHLQPVREEPKELYLLKENSFDEEEYYGIPSYLELNRRNNFLNKKLNDLSLAKGIRIKKEKSVGFLQYRPNEKSFYTDLKEASSGLLQVLPVFFKSYIADKLFIEQPELHLHPSLQALLAEYFAVVIKEKDLLSTPFFLIETHSEHLIRKIQVCIAKGILKKEDVGVFYFDKDFGTGKTKLKEMVIEENGFFKESWPNGFFDDSYNLTKELLRANKN